MEYLFQSKTCYDVTGNQLEKLVLNKVYRDQLNEFELKNDGRTIKITLI